MDLVPSQVAMLLSSWNPFLHEHSKEPGVLRQFWEHVAIPLVHSSISTGKIIKQGQVLHQNKLIHSIFFSFILLFFISFFQLVNSFDLSIHSIIPWYFILYIFQFFQFIDSYDLFVHSSILYFYLSIGHVCILFSQSLLHSFCLKTNKQTNVWRFTPSVLFTCAVCVRITFEPKVARAVKWTWQVCAERILRAVMPRVDILAFIYFWKVTLTVNPPQNLRF